MKKSIFITILFFVSACASIYDGGTQRIKVEVISVENNLPLRGARCSISDEMGTVYVMDDNPGSIVVKKGQGTLEFSCKKAGYIQKNTDATERFNGTAFFNVFTLGAGFFVDAVTGAMLEYPKKIVIRMAPEEW